LANHKFSKDRYGVDVLKVEVPVSMTFVEGAKDYAGQKTHSKKDAMELFRQGCRGGYETVYLSLSRGEQRGLHGIARTGCRSRPMAGVQSYLLVGLLLPTT
jgi:tagatose-1,6-bisphosphate aldolase